MLFRILVTLLLVLSASASTAQVVIKNHPLEIGETTVILREYSRGEGPTFLRVHQNETDAGIVGQRLVSEMGGRFIDILHSGTRFVSFVAEKHVFRIDPNRIFTKKGIERTVRESAAYDTLYVRAEVTKLAKTILALIGKKQPVIALHNNTGGAFRLAQYQPGGFFHVPGHTVAHHGLTGQHTFAIVTTSQLADAFVRARISVVYQPHSVDRDDGSLSYRYGRDGVRYINVEALYGDAKRQQNVAQFAAGLILARPPAVGGL